MDCDMLCRADIAELFEIAGREMAAVSVVKHDYQPSTQSKFLGHEQSRYQRKNWSSVMHFNCNACRALTPEYIDRAPGLELHQFDWVNGEIGSLPIEWNHLVGEYPPNPQAKLVHFTLGTPCFHRFSTCEFAREWYAERDQMLHYERPGEYSKPERIEA